MKPIFQKFVMASAAAMFSGCANMPDFKDLPNSKFAIPGMSSSTNDSLLSGVKGAADGIREFTDEEEIALGEEAMALVLGANPLYEDESIQRYVNRVGRWIASHSERPNLPWRFAVIKSKDAGAGAAPGGQIYISSGLLGQMRSEAELAGALSHEIAHVVKKHHLSAFQKKGLGKAFMSGAGELANRQIKGDLAKQGTKFLVGEVKTIFTLSLDRREEEQADRMAMALAARAGYNPYGLPTVLQILQDISPDNGKSLMYKTHPSPASRLEALDKAVGNSFESYGNLPLLRERFVSNVGGVSISSSAIPTPPSAKAPSAPRKK